MKQGQRFGVIGAAAALAVVLIVVLVGVAAPGHKARSVGGVPSSAGPLNQRGRVSSPGTTFDLTPVPAETTTTARGAPVVVPTTVPPPTTTTAPPPPTV